MFMCQGTSVTLFIVIKSCYCSLRTYSDVWGPTNQSFCCKKYMLLLLMTIVYSHGSICFIANLKCFNISLNFNLLLSADLITRSSLSSLTGWGGGGGRVWATHFFFHQVGISHQVSCPHTHQPNGAAERKHHHIVEMGLSLLATTSMPLKYWDETFLAPTYLINHTPTKLLVGVLYLGYCRSLFMIQKIWIRPGFLQWQMTREPSTLY
jgi:hypothetical protein